MKRLYWITLLTVVIAACNLSSSKQKSGDDSLQYYPPTPEAISKDEFRKYYRELGAHFDTLLPKGEFNGGILIAKNGAVIYEKYQGKVDLRQSDTISIMSSRRFSRIETPAMIRQVSTGLRSASGVMRGRLTGRLAPRSSANRNSSAVSKRCFGSFATALSNTFSSQPGMSWR